MIAAANRRLNQASVDAWPVESPREWPVLRLRFCSAVNPSRSELNGIPDDTEVSFVPMESVCEYGGLRLDQTKPLAEVSTGYTYFREGDVVVAKITPCFENGKGSIAKGLTSGIGFGTTELHVLRSMPRLDPAFLFYLTISHPFRSIGAAYMYGAGGQKRVPDDFVRDFRHPIPPHDEQSAIAAFLDRETARIDALIEKKRRQIELLHEKRAALISHAVTKGLDPTAPMKDSGIDWLAQIPAHWRVAQLRRALRWIEQGWSPQCENRQAEDGEWAVLKAGCANYGLFDEGEHKALPADVEPARQYEIQPGDLLMSRACGTPTLVGSVAIVEACRSRLLLCDKVFRLHPEPAAIEVRFLHLALNSRMARYQIEQSLTGADGLANNVTQESIKGLVLALPPREEQQSIIAATVTVANGKIDDLVGKINLSIDRLREYRTALISAAVTGKIDVRDGVVP